MNDNVIFDFLEEGMPIKWILQNMGFEAKFLMPFLEEYNSVYEGDPLKWMEVWQPENIPEFTLVSKYDTEDGPCAMYVKPLTYLAKSLLEFGFSDIAQNSARLGDIPPKGEIIQG